MRNALILLAPLLLAGCVNESASYQIDGNEHALTVRAQQDYFWDKQVTLRLIASRLPDCQRQLVLGKVALSDLDVELFSNEGVYTLRAGEQVWQIDSGNCAQLATPAPDAFGQPVGVFRLNEDKKMVFEAAAAGTTTAAAQ